MQTNKTKKKTPAEVRRNAARKGKQRAFRKATTHKERFAQIPSDATATGKLYRRKDGTFTGELITWAPNRCAVYNFGGGDLVQFVTKSALAKHWENV